MRRALLSVVIALAGAAAVTASGWALQAAALAPPKPAARVAVDASTWFHEYRLVLDVFHLDHRTMKGACLRGWFTRRDGTAARASLLSVANGPILRVSGKGRVSAVSGGRGRRFQHALLAADAGCSRTLAGTLAAAAQHGGHLSTERGYAANRPAIALELRRGPKERLTLYVSPRTDRPLVSIVHLNGRTITCRIHLQKVTPRALAPFRVAHRLLQERLH